MADKEYWRRGGIEAYVGEREVRGWSASVCLLFSTSILDEPELIDFRTAS
jgi:hypothetical protein